jgi:tRNA(Ile2) C34 agmatinyltransferase TiaS
MNITDKLNAKLAKRDRIEAKAEAKRQELAKQSIETNTVCPNCNKEMQPMTASDKPCFTCFGCRICFPRN